METFKQKQSNLLEAIKNYELGFITPVEFLNQIITMEWNPLERKAIYSIMERTVTINTDVIKELLK